MMPFPGGIHGKEPGCQCRRYKRHGFDPWVGEIPGEGNGNPLQPSCLENPMDRGTWWATFYGVTKSQTQLKWLNMTSFLVKASEYRQYTWKASPIDRQTDRQTDRDKYPRTEVWDTCMLNCVWLFATPWTIPTRLLCPWIFSIKNTGVGYHFLLQGVFPSQGLNLLSSILAGIFITTEPPWNPRGLWYLKVIMLVVLERIRRLSQNWLRRRCQQGIWTKWNRNNDQMINMDLGWFIGTQGQPKELGHCPSVCYVQLLGEFWLAWTVSC